MLISPVLISSPQILFVNSEINATPPKKLEFPLQKTEFFPGFDAYVPADRLKQVMTFIAGALADAGDNEHINTAPAGKQTSPSDTCEHI